MSIAIFCYEFCFIVVVRILRLSKFCPKFAKNTFNYISEKKIFICYNNYMRKYVKKFNLKLLFFIVFGFGAIIYMSVFYKDSVVGIVSVVQKQQQESKDTNSVKFERASNVKKINLDNNSEDNSSEHGDGKIVDNLPEKTRVSSQLNQDLSKNNSNNDNALSKESVVDNNNPVVQKLQVEKLDFSVQKKEKEYMQLIKLVLNKTLQNNKVYYIDTSGQDYDEYFLSWIDNNENSGFLVGTIDDVSRIYDKTLADLQALLTPVAKESARTGYVSHIIYEHQKYIVILPKKEITLSAVDLWKFNDNAQNQQDGGSVAGLADVGQAQGNISSFVSVSDLFSQNTASTQDASAYATRYTKDVSSGIKVSSLDIVPRSYWGANPAKWDPYRPTLDINNILRLKYIIEGDCQWLPEYYRVSRFVIHHTVTSNYPTDPYREVREIYLYHAYARGWGDIGYNFLIDSEGRIFEGKIGGDGVKGYHAYEAANDMSIGIGLIGNFTYSNPSGDQLYALKNLLAEKAILFGIDHLRYCDADTITQWTDPTCTVFGHRHVYVWGWDTNDWYKKPTACPGEKFVTSGTLASAVSTAEYYRSTRFTTLKDARNWAENFLDDSQSLYYILVDFNNGSTFVPKYSGIWSARLKNDDKLYLTLKSYDNGYCGLVVPPAGWNGYDDCGPHGCMFFPASKGIYDRAVVLLTALKLNPYVANVSLSDANLATVAGTTGSIGSGSSEITGNSGSLQQNICIQNKDVGD